MSAIFGGKRGILDTAVQFFTEDDWKFRQLEGKTILQMGFRGENGAWQCFADAKEDKQRFIFFSAMDTRVPEDKRPAVADYLTRANYGLILGNFEMDFRDGEIRYKTSIDVEGGELTTQMVKTLVYVNVMMMDKYLPGVMSVIYANTPPADAVAKIEAP